MGKEWVHYSDVVRMRIFPTSLRVDLYLKESESKKRCRFEWTRSSPKKVAYTFAPM